MDEKRENQIVESIKKIDPKVIADLLRGLLHESDDEPVQRPPINPSQHPPK